MVELGQSSLVRDDQLGIAIELGEAPSEENTKWQGLFGEIGSDP
jgi:hypothetical protein